MKKLFFSLIALLLVAVACQQEPAFNYEGKDAVDVTIGINVPDLNISRSGETEMDSALGAIDNFTNANLWSEFDVRYVMEIFDVTPGYENLNTPVKKRMVNILDEYAETTFNLRLIPNRTYKFVVWADFVADGSHAVADYTTVEGLNYDITDLRDIKRKEWRAMDECMDAYFIQQDIAVTTMLDKTLTLKRPFGKLRVIASDIEELNIGTVPYNVEVEFYNHQSFSSLNALTGNIATELTSHKYTYTIDKSAPYSEGWDRLSTYQTLFADYLYASDDASEVNFKIKVSEQNGRKIANHDFNTQIPIQRNHLTTIIGNLLTTATKIAVNIDDNFAGEYINNFEEPTTELSGTWNAPTTDANGNIVYELNNGSDNFTLVVNKAAAENGTLKAGTYTYADDATEEGTFTISGLMAETRALVEVSVVDGEMTVTANDDNTLTIDFELYLNYGKDENGKDMIYATTYSFTGAVATPVEPTVLDTPEVKATVNGNVVVLSWAAIENAAMYSITVGTEMPVFTEETSYTFTGEYETTYTFAVVAVPDNEVLYAASEAATAAATTEAYVPHPIATPVIEATISNYKDVTFEWNANDLAEKYIVIYDGTAKETTETSYTINGDYETTYTISVVAVPADTKLYANSAEATATATTEADPYIYLKPNSNWTQANARFAVYTWAAEKWVDMVDSDGDGIYEVLKSELHNNVIFCRMNPGATANNWNNKWNQTADLTLPTNGNNLYTIAAGTWDNGGGTWSKK